MKNRFLQFSALILCVFIFFSFGHNTSNSKGLYSDFSSIKLPKELYFCGEKVPLEIPEVKQRAERELYLMLQQPGQIMLYIKRAGKYFPMYERIIKKHGLPQDMKYLSVAESALFMSRSPRGAVGLWQFIKKTGKAVGLQIDDNVDERRHPEKSTEAAMVILKEAYNATKSWTLASAGYNMGFPRVLSNMKYQAVRDYYDLFLNEETSRYIFRILIIKEIMTNQSKYGFHVKENEKFRELASKNVKVTKEIKNLSDWALGQGTTYKFIKLLNPWILKRTLPKPKRGKFYKIKVPFE